MKKFETPVVELVKFNVMDVVSTSAGCADDTIECADEMPLD